MRCVSVIERGQLVAAGHHKFVLEEGAAKCAVGVVDREVDAQVARLELRMDRDRGVRIGQVGGDNGGLNAVCRSEAVRERFKVGLGTCDKPQARAARG
ncbi:MAG: hypothetical protein NVSMB64_05530 [Candidatus Velthaea sp.]